MTEFLNFFEAMPAWQKLGWIVGCLWFSWSLEGFIPLVRFQYRKWSHARVNFVFLATTVTINLLFGLLTLGVFNWVGSNSFGLLYLFDLPRTSDCSYGAGSHRSILGTLLIAQIQMDVEIPHDPS